MSILLKSGSLAALMTVSFTIQAEALQLAPGDADFSGFNNGSLSLAQVQAAVGESPLFEVYKQNVGGSEYGSFGGSYTTTFDNTPSDPSDAEIKYDGGTFITGSSIYLYVKDGTPEPWYIFDITGWGGQESIELTGFYPASGAISHVTIYTANGNPPSVPDGGLTVMMLGTALGGLGLMRRFLKH